MPLDSLAIEATRSAGRVFTRLPILTLKRVHNWAQILQCYRSKEKIINKLMNCGSVYLIDGDTSK